MAAFVYLHECFPEYTKTFVYREVAAMPGEPLVFSVREPEAEDRAKMEMLSVAVRYLPPEAELREIIERERGSFSSQQRRALSHWRAQKGDSTRVFEALWLGCELRRLGVRHVHAHFAGLAARTAWLVRELWGIGYSFTGHADDIFSPEERPISLEMLVRDARFIATETDYSRRWLEEKYAAARGKTHRVFNGIALGGFPPRAEAPGAPRILSVGRLVEKKGFPTLLAACALLRGRGVDFRCDIVGYGPLRASLAARIAELGLGNHVALLGPRPQGEVRQLLASARVFALAAQREGDGGSDNLPTVIMEAMAAGVPVVSTRIAGIPEMVDGGETGYLTAEQDVPAFADRLATLLADALLAAQLGEAGRLRAEEKFSVTNTTAALAGLIAAHGKGLQPWWRRFLSGK